MLILDCLMKPWNIRIFTMATVSLEVIKTIQPTTLLGKFHSMPTVDPRHGITSIAQSEIIAIMK